MNERCCVCGGDHVHSGTGEVCPLLREAAEAGRNAVPLRIYGGYMEARAALRANAHQAAIRVLHWIVSHIAEERGAPADKSFRAKLQGLLDQKVITKQVHDALAERALQTKESPEQAWALMSIVEHVFYRLYLKPAGAP